MLGDSEQQQIADFVRANDRSPVVEGYVIGEGGKGSIYHLSDGTVFKLNRNECAGLPSGYPKWQGLRDAD